MEDDRFPRRFMKAGRYGTYLRIAAEGEIGAGDEIRVVAQPDHGVSIGDVFRIYAGDRGEAERLLRVPALSTAWRSWAERQVGGTGRG
jgi:MOSC domain-containing protein YiiM